MRTLLVVSLIIIYCVCPVLADATFNIHNDYFGGAAGNNLGNFTLGNISGGKTEVVSDFIRYGGDSNTWAAAAWTKTRFNRTDAVRVNFTVWWPVAYNSGASTVGVGAMLNSSNVTRDSNYYYPTGAGYVYFWELPHPPGNTSPIKYNISYSVAFDGLGNKSIDGGTTWSNLSGIPDSYDIEFLGGGYGTTTYVYFWNISVDTYIETGSPVASFTASNTTGIYPPSLPVGFTDTSTNTPTSWEWNFTNTTGNNTAVTFATTQNPLWYFDIGNYSISLNATNSYGSDVSDQVTWINVSAPTTLSLAEFTGMPLSGTAPLSVTFTDADGTGETSWSWIFGDGNTTGNTLQNPVHLYTASGTYTVNHSATNSIGTNWTNKTGYITVVNASGFTPQDIWMEGQYIQTFHITDSSTGLPIPIVQLQDTAMQTFTTTNGTGYLTEEFGPSTVVFMATGYNSKAVSYFFDSEATHTVQMVASSPAPVPNTNTIFSPRLVRLRSVDQWRTPLTPVTITASYIADTLPNNDPVYLQNAFGVSESVVSLMMNSSVAMSGVTGSDGSNTFSMFPALTYNITVTNETMGVHCQQNLAPADTDYVLYCPTDAQKAAVIPLSQTLNRSYIWVTEPNASFVTINASYQDPDGLTSSVLFNVSVVDNNTVIYSKNFGNPGTSQVLDNYTMPNIRGMQIKSYLAYNRST